jgi:hypothetical protein
MGCEIREQCAVDPALTIVLRSTSRSLHACGSAVSAPGSVWTR